MSIIDDIAGTKTREAKVAIVNNTGRALAIVSVSHKYSDEGNCKKDIVWLGPIKPNEETPPKSVKYHTGPLTTGRDWWVVSWAYADKAEAFHTDPQNFRKLLDWPEAALHNIAAVVDWAAGGFLAKDIAPFLGKWLKSLGIPESWLPEMLEGVEDASKAKAACLVLGCIILTKELTNTESTVGYKQHILRSDDANKITQIEIGKGNHVIFNSHSGKSETGSAKIDPAKLM